MEIITFLTVALTVCVCQVQRSESATLRTDNDAASDLVYSDVSAAQRERLYRQLRQYGVPPDVAHMYVPRGLTIGEVLGQDKPSHHNNHDHETDTDGGAAAAFDPWSIVWYIGSFGGLIAFFLVISCSEWCCLRRRGGGQGVAATLGGCTPPPPPPPPRTTPATPATPPPGYHLFAPPSYQDTLGPSDKRTFDVFVVPVHALPQLKPPPPPYHEQV